MLLSRSWILAEATSTLIQTFSIVFFLYLYYTYITYGKRKSNKQRAKGNKKRVKSNEQRGKGNEKRALQSYSKFNVWLIIF